jgi:predicted nucleic acid-binding protein
MNDEGALEFVDTNVMVYAHDSSTGKKHELAKDLIRRLWDSRKGCLSIQVLQEFYVTVTHKVAKPLDPDVAKELVQDLAQWRLHAPEAADVVGAIDLQRKHSISFWDAMILWSAGRLGCGIVWSEDLSPGQRYEGVRVANPFTRETLST